MTTLTVFLINVHAHLIIFFLSILISNKSAQNLRRTENFKKINLVYLHCRTHFTKAILAKTL
jgi:hypothetical protein